MPRTKKVIEIQEILNDNENTNEQEPIDEVENNEVENNETENLQINENEETLEDIEDCKKMKKPEEKTYKKKGTSRNKVRTQAQKDAWALCLERKKIKQDEVRAQKAEDQRILAEYKENLKKLNEKKIVKKAIAIKKKQIMLEEELESTDDEIPIEEVKEKIKKSRKVNKTIVKEYPGPDNQDRFIINFI